MTLGQHEDNIEDDINNSSAQSLLTSLLIYFNLRLCRMKLSSMSDVLHYDIRLSIMLLLISVRANFCCPPRKEMSGHE